MNNNEINNNLDTVSGVDRVSRKKGGKIAAVVGAVAVVAAGGGIAAYNFSDYVKNQVKLKVSSPEKYYAWVNEENSKTLAKEISDRYRQSIDKIKAGATETLNLKYEPSEEIKSSLIEEITNGETNEEYQMITDIINNVANIELGITGSSFGDTASGSIYGNLNSERLLTFDFAIDGTQAFGRIAELTDRWIGTDLSETISDITYNEDSEKQLNAYNEFVKDPESFMTPEELEDLITRYSAVWNNSVEDVTLEKSESVAVLDISTDYTVVSVEIDSEKAKQISENFINEAKNDTFLKTLVVDKFQICTEEEYNQSLDDALSELNEESEIKNVVTLNAYIDPKGTIRGYSVDAGEEGSFSFIIAKDDSLVRAESYFIEDGNETCRFELYADENDDKYTGYANFTADGETVKADFTDIEVVNKDYGYINGSVTVTIPDSDPFTIDFASDGSSQEFAGDLNIEGENYGRITFTLSVNEGASPEIPDKDGALIVDENSSDFISEYVDQSQFETFVHDLLIKIGVNEEYSKSISSMAGSSLYNTYEYNFNYDDDDDFDYDWDDDDDDYDIPEKSDDDDKITENEISEEEVSEKDDDNDDDFSDSFYDNQIGLTVMDNSENVLYIAGLIDDDDTGIGVNPEITGNGTYTATYTLNDDVTGDGFSVLAVGGYNVENAENVMLEIKSLKIDGNDIKVSSAYRTDGYDDGTVETALYYAGDDSYNFADVENIGEWKSIEVTFEVMGLD